MAWQLGMAPCCSPCLLLLLLPDPGDIFQLSPSRWFLCSLGPFSGSACFIGAWLSQGTRAVRGQGHRAIPPLVTHQPDGHQHPPGATSWGAAGVLCPLLSFRVELLGQSPAGKLRAGYQGSPAALWVLQVGSQARSPLLLPTFVKMFRIPAPRWALSDALEDAQSGPLSISKAPVHSWCPNSCQN